METGPHDGTPATFGGTRKRNICPPDELTCRAGLRVRLYDEFRLETDTGYAVSGVGIAGVASVLLSPAVSPAVETTPSKARAD